MNKAKLNELIASELDAVDSKWSDYHSHHEAYAVIKEEFEELKHDVKIINYSLKGYWRDIKKPSDEFDKNYLLGLLKDNAYNAIQEAVQVYVTALRAERLCKK